MAAFRRSALQSSHLMVGIAVLVGLGVRKGSVSRPAPRVAFSRAPPFLLQPSPLNGLAWNRMGVTWSGDVMVGPFPRTQPGTGLPCVVVAGLKRRARLLEGSYPRRP